MATLMKQLRKLHSLPQTIFILNADTIMYSFLIYKFPEELLLFVMKRGDKLVPFKHVLYSNHKQNTWKAAFDCGLYELNLHYYHHLDMLLESRSNELSHCLQWPIVSLLPPTSVPSIHPFKKSEAFQRSLVEGCNKRFVALMNNLFPRTESWRGLEKQRTYRRCADNGPLLPLSPVSKNLNDGLPMSQKHRLSYRLCLSLPQP